MRAATAILLLGLCFGSAAAQAPVVPGASAGSVAERPRSGAPLPEGIAAAARGAQLSFADLEGVLCQRYGTSEDGRKVLEHLLKTRLLELLCVEQQLVIDEREVEQRYLQLDAEARAAGQGGIERQIAASGLTRDYFRSVLRLALAQERLTTRALGLGAGQSASGEQQEVWLEELLQKRGAELLARPWPLDEAGQAIAARCQGVQIGEREFAAALTRGLSLEPVRDTCFQMLLLQRLEARLRESALEPAPEQLRAALDRELARRRDEIERDPRYKGIAWEQLLAAQGLDPKFMDRDPAVRVAALATHAIDTAHGEAGLRAVYEAEREYFEMRFGEALRLRLCYLRASHVSNPLVPRTFAEATAELERRARDVRDEAAFTHLAEVLCDEPGLKKVGGDLGWATRGDARLTQDLRDFVFTEVARRPLEPGGRVAGPYTLPGGVGLVWIAERRESPDWSSMRAEVHRELRRRYLEECLPRSEVRTYLDVVE